MKPPYPFVHGLTHFHHTEKQIEPFCNQHSCNCTL